jgi:hypothetical protein
MSPRPNSQRQIVASQIERWRGALKAPHLEILQASLTQSYQEMAVSLDIPLGSVRSRLHRARAILLSFFKHPNGAPMYAKDGTMLDEHGNRSIFDDVDK